MWGEGEFRELWHLAKASAPCSKKQRVPLDDTVKKMVNSTISLVQDGLFGKACQVLVSVANTSLSCFLGPPSVTVSTPFCVILWAPYIRNIGSAG